MMRLWAPIFCIVCEKKKDLEGNVYMAPFNLLLEVYTSMSSSIYFRRWVLTHWILLFPFCHLLATCNQLLKVHYNTNLATLRHLSELHLEEMREIQNLNFDRYYNNVARARIALRSFFSCAREIFYYKGLGCFWKNKENWSVFLLYKNRQLTVSPWYILRHIGLSLNDNEKGKKRRAHISV